MKRIIGTIAAVAVIVVVGIAVWWGYDQVFVTSDAWYAQVDNEQMSQAGENNNGFDYHYELVAANEAGETQTLGFDTSRELRDDAYLCLETMAMRGVVRWHEVSWDEIPAQAQAALDS